MLPGLMFGRLRHRHHRDRRRSPLAARCLSRAIESLECRRLLAAHIVGNATVYSTIQAAVDAAAAGATVTVDPGNYAELVSIFKPLTIKGAQAGVDGRSNARGVNESICTGEPTGTGFITSAFKIGANDVTIDGFVVQGETSQSTTNGAGIVMLPNINGTRIINNVVQNNVAGIYLSNNSSTNPAIIQHNLFQNNNNDGSNGGRAIYTDLGISGGLLTNVTIDNNFFFKNYGGPATTTVEAAISFESFAVADSQTNIRVTNNAFDSDGKAVLAVNVNGLTIQGNVIEYTRDYKSGGLRFEGGDNNVTIQNNLMYDNGGRAIRIDKKSSSNDNLNFVITNNNFSRNGLDLPGHDALAVDALTFVGTLDARNNWWGNASGPSGDGPGTGDGIFANGNSITFTPFATAPVFDRQFPYTLLPWAATSLIEFENYDHGGEGVAFHDSDAANNLSRLHPYQAVDIEATTDTGAGYDVGSVKAGEWIEYTVNVPQAGTYSLDLRVANAAVTGGTLHVEVDGVNVSGPITLINTGGLQTWATQTKTGINLPAGQHVVRFAMDANGSGGSVGNLNWFRFNATSVTPTPLPPSNLLAVAASASQINLTWSDNSGDETGFKLERSADNITFTQIATPGANATSYNDAAGLLSGTKYYYRIRATNAGGDSAFSNVANATTSVSGGATYVSDLPFVSSSNGWGPIERDQSVGGSGAGDGKTITLNGVTYTKGLGAHAISDVVFNLGGAYSSFLSDIGVDDETGAGSSVIFQVFADSVKVYDSGVMGQTTATRSINLSMSGVQQLRLHVDDAGDGIDYDHADWAGARLTTASQPQPPASPSSLVATAASTTQINLTWTDNSSNEANFIIERSLDGVNNWTQIATPAAGATSYNDATNLSASTKYYYRIRAHNAAGDSANSNIASATTLSAGSVPADPSNLAATAPSSTQINLTWSDNSGNETGFKLERGTDGVSFAQIATPAANAVSYSDTTNLLAGTKYYYRIRATNAVGDSGYSNIANATTLASSSVTYIATGSTWKYLDNGTNQGTAWRATSFVDTTWKSGAAQLGYGDGDEATVVSFGADPNNKFITTYFRRSFNVADPSQVSALNLRVLRDDGAVIYLNGTEVFRSNMPTGTIAYNTLAATSIGGTDETTFYPASISPALLLAGGNVIAVEVHQADVTSSDVSFDFELTATASQTPTAPAAPSNLVATAAGTAQINLTWSDNSSNETGFKLERGTDGVNFTQIATPAAGATSYNDTASLAPATKYYYRIRATNTVGDSAFSNIANATTAALATKPAAPSNLLASAVASNRINLTWTDNSGDESNFILERSPDGVNNWSQIATPAANAVSYSDTALLSPSTPYFYRIRATNGAGDSANSNIASATTLASTALPAPWVDSDVGSTGAAGSATYSGGTFTVNGSGSDISGGSDSFHYVYQPLSGDGTIIARVASVQNTNDLAKAGVMMRETLNAKSKEAGVYVTPAGGVSFIRRSKQAGASTATTVSGITAPCWVKLIRSGDTFTAYRSADGVNWVLIGSSTISMSSTIYVGLAVSSHRAGVLNTSTFDGVALS